MGSDILLLKPSQAAWRWISFWISDRRFANEGTSKRLVGHLGHFLRDYRLRRDSVQ